MRTRYGVLYLSGNGPYQLKIAEKQNFQTLYGAAFSTLGLIVSLRGAKITFFQRAQDITVGEIIRALEGPIELADCVGGPAMSRKENVSQRTLDGNQRQHRDGLQDLMDN